MAEELTENQVNDFRETFNLFDDDGGGTISTDELGEVMKRLGQNPSKRELDDLIAEVDQDGNGEVDFDEFLQLMAKKLKGMDIEEEIREAFKVFDTQESGKISSNILKEIMVHYGRLSEEEVAEMVTIADTDGDGDIQYSEFVQVMTEK